VTRRHPNGGYCLIEVLFVGWIGMVICGVAIPRLLVSLDVQKTTGAVRYLTSICARARAEAVLRSTEVAVRFEEDARGYAFAVYADGNGDGVRTRDIQRGIDVPLTRPERLSTNFPGVAVAVPAGLPPVEGGPPTDGDPVKLGPGNLLSFSALGSSSPGSVYVRGQSGSQFVVRALGETGRIRTLKFDAVTRRWNPS
jgi:hypothetical protein